MNSRSELRSSYHVSSSIIIHLSCHALFVCLLCIYCFLPPPLFSGRPRCYRRLHRYRVRLLHRRPYPYCRATRQAEPLPLSHISPTFLYLSFALGICCCYVTFLFKCIACLCRPLMHLFLILLQPI